MDRSEPDSVGSRAAGAATFDQLLRGAVNKLLLSHGDEFVTTVTERLLTYALGRGLEAFDAPAVRQIKRGAGSDEYRFEALIQGVVTSPPFQMRMAGARAN